MKKFAVLFLSIISFSGLLNSSNEAFLGVYIEQATQETLINAGLRNGLVIERVVPNSPAEIAGLQVSDILTRLNNGFIYDENSFKRTIDNSKPGDKITLTVFRNGREQNLNVILGRREHYILNFNNLSIVNTPINSIGVRVEALNYQLSQFFEVDHGLLVLEVFQDSPAYENGILAGDIILAIDNQKMITAVDFQDMLNNKRHDDYVLLDIHRKNDFHLIETRVVTTENIITIDLDNIGFHNYLHDLNLDYLSNYIDKSFSSYSNEEIEEMIKKLRVELEKLEQKLLE